jgi:DNA-binding NarL/FixJ family response regulator
MNHSAVLKSFQPSYEPTGVSVENSRPHVHRSAVKNNVSAIKHERNLLTDREGVIIAFIGSGQTNKEIARELGVTPETIKSHLKRIFKKLSASTRAEAVVQAQNIGGVEFPISNNLFANQGRQLRLDTDSR